MSEEMQGPLQGSEFLADSDEWKYIMGDIIQLDALVIGSNEGKENEVARYNIFLAGQGPTGKPIRIAAGNAHNGGKWERNIMQCLAYHYIVPEEILKKAIKELKEKRNAKE